MYMTYVVRKVYAFFVARLTGYKYNLLQAGKFLDSRMQFNVFLTSTSTVFGLS
jgi:hypothetical protein